MLGSTPIFLGSTPIFLKLEILHFNACFNERVNSFYSGIDSTKSELEFFFFEDLDLVNFVKIFFKDYFFNFNT